ncbi:alpha/beta fold hydrolase [Propionicimonas sp.]|uniref:alpha/beta fold hydrolase n=1 Tax=Propionicimonas sp. TaxID=1955623 RepID=UPI0039E2FCAC
MTPTPDRVPAATRYLQRHDGRIAYELRGSGPLVVLVPGMADLRSSYRFLAPALVEAGYTVASTDLRGHGDSDTTFGAYGDPETASDVAALIAELGGPAVIVGNSLAAGAGVIVAADHPDRVSGLVLIGPFVRNPPTAAPLRVMFRVMTATPWVAAVWGAYLPSLYAGRKPDDFDDYRAAVLTAMRRPGHRRAFSRTAREADHARAEARLGEVDVPVLVVMGENDPDFADPPAEARWIADTLHGDVAMVAEAGHYPQSQQPQVTTEAVLTFLGRHGRG